MSSPEDTGSSGLHSENYYLDDRLEDYLLAKSKTGGTGNYRRNAERGFDAVPEARDRVFVATIAYSGARGGELVRDLNDARRESVRWKDVDFDDGTVWVLDTGDQEYAQASLPRQAVSTLGRYREIPDPPTEEYPVFPTFHAPTLACTARDGLHEQGLDADEIEGSPEEVSTKKVLHENGIAPPAIMTDGTRRLMERLSAEADIPDLDTDAGEYLELYGGRRGAGDTLVREVGWKAARRLLRHKSPETTMDAYSYISASEIAEDAGDAFNEADRQ